MDEHTFTNPKFALFVEATDYRLSPSGRSMRRIPEPGRNC